MLVIVVVGILAGSSLGLFQHFLHTGRYLPSEAKVAQAASEIFEAVAEGTLTMISGSPVPSLRGVRFARRPLPTTSAILSADANEVRYVTDGACEAGTQLCLVRLRLDTAAKQLMRSYAVGAGFSSEEPIPYYAAEGLKTEGTLGSPPGQLFQYSQADGTLISPLPMLPGDARLGTIRRVEVGARVSTGTGDFSRGEGRLSVTSSVAIRFP